MLYQNKVMFCSVLFLEMLFHYLLKFTFYDYSGRSDRQSSTDQQGRDQPRVLRVPSRRQARRAISDPRLNGTISSFSKQLSYVS